VLSSPGSQHQLDKNTFLSRSGQNSLPLLSVVLLQPVDDSLLLLIICFQYRNYIEAYPNLLGTKGYVVVVVVTETTSNVHVLCSE
jgi:hypothetical protein